ncbi:NAD(P)H-hydrate dehydratase [Dechloromonas sp. ZY10]|uniref:NAD(P)H-hydrate dehydratase n=1 Tax=Dechloromonas aquae TaxID=2664436 RepID=UPI003529A02B
MPAHSSPLHFAASLRQIEARFADQPLMERAGAAAAGLCRELLGNCPGPVLLLAGPGNNGGDALVAARLLSEQGIDCCVVFAGDAARLPADAAAAHARFAAAGGTLHGHFPAQASGHRWALIVDGLLGIGLTRAPEGRISELIVAANRLAQTDGCPLLALDCPSGLLADTGGTPGHVIRASHTLSFIAGKPGLWTANGPDCCGEIRIADLDLPGLPELPADGHLIDLSDFAQRLQPRRANTHKGSFGSAGVLGGGKAMVGAALLTARAALHLGAGRVYVGLLDPEAPSVDLQQPELMLRRPEHLLQADLQALACGPGLGTSGDAARMLEQALKCPLPLVLDADALNLLASDSRLAGHLCNRVAPAILTPHPAEAARLLECSTREIQENRIAAANELVRRYGCQVVLKGCGSVVATVDGRWWINSTGNPGLATAGSGDVLSGLILALLAQGWRVHEALLAGVHLHGAAADWLVGEGCGPVGLTAGELIPAARRLLNCWLQAPWRTGKV